jgi:hypothetical protein
MTPLGLLRRLVVLLTIGVMGITGCGTGGTGRGFAVTVVNDGKRPVEIQPCGPEICSNFHAIELLVGARYTWHTTDSGAGIHSFGVHVPGGRSLGCLGPHGFPGGARITLDVSSLEECVT